MLKFYRQTIYKIIKKLGKYKKKITIIDIDDKQANLTDQGKIGGHEYESFLKTGDENYHEKPKDEGKLLHNYTSGTTGQPKGVVYHHRGSYLMSVGSVTAWNMPNKLTYLYTVPMFHCNGWGYPDFGIAHKGIFIRNIVVKEIFKLIVENVTHFGGAPIVLI